MDNRRGGGTHLPTLNAMTRIRVDADAVVALGAAVSDLSVELRDCAASASEGSWALGSGASASALADVLGDFEHARLVLGRHLDELGQLARVAGALYAEVEADATSSMVGGSW